MHPTGPNREPAVSQTRVFVVDDHALIRDSIRQVLQKEADLVLIGETGSATAAAELIPRQQPDVVLMDISFPEGDGLETIQQIRHHVPQSRVLVLTMHEDDAYVQTLREAGVQGYLLKRSAGDELVRAIRRVANGEIYMDPALTPFPEPARKPKTKSHRERRHSLTEQEEKVLRLYAQGYSVKEISTQLSLSPKTIETYRKRAMTKLGIDGRAELQQYALKSGWL